jgi:hypothetical protein
MQSPFLCNEVPQAIPLFYKAPVLLTKKSQCWKLQRFSIVDNSYPTVIIIMHTGINLLLITSRYLQPTSNGSLYLQHFVPMPKPITMSKNEGEMNEERVSNKFIE